VDPAEQSSSINGGRSARFAVTRDGQRFAIMSRGASDYSAISVILGWSPQSAAGRSAE